LATIR
jgi:putative transposase